MRYLIVKNWGEFQHYKDRNPPWIKLHRALLDDYEFARLPDASKAHLMLIWLLASQSNGRIPHDPKFLQAKLGLDKQPDLQVLVDSGFLLMEHDASGSAEQDASNTLGLARSREERTKAAEESNAGFAAFWLAYPKRVAKEAAHRAWKKLALNAEQITFVMAALERAKSSEEWRKDGGRYIPYPATWLNGRRFEDELQLPAPQGQPAVGPMDYGNCACGVRAIGKVNNEPRCQAHLSRAPQKMAAA